MNKQKTYNVVGVMSGTSLDGLDLAMCTFYKGEKDWNYKIHKAVTYKYNHLLKDLLREAYSCTSRRYMEIDHQFGLYIGDSVLSFIKSTGIKIDFISSHGHTIFHEPDKGYSCQIGSGASIVAKTGIRTICNFRQLDIARGGQGAPLVPVGDELLFSDYSACLNLGGFANISYNKNGNRIAFDICPVNIILNHLCQQIGLDFDRNGDIAASGKIIPEVYNELNSISYYTKQAPKSLSFEWIEQYIFPILAKNKNESKEDLIKTLTDHIVCQISQVLNELPDNQPIMITGGGAFNKYMIYNLKKMVNRVLFLPKDELINFKEALIFALLGVLRVRNEYNCFASVTGASENSICGIDYIP